MALWKKMVQLPSPKKEIRSPNTEAPQEIWNLFSPYLQDTKKKEKKQWVGGVYTMEIKDTNNECQKFVRVRDQKW